MSPNLDDPPGPRAQPRNLGAGPARYPDTQAEPPGWPGVLTGGAGPLGTLFAAVAGEIDDLTDRAVDRIRHGVAQYARVEPRQRGDLWWSTKRSIQTALVHLAEQRPLSEEDLSHRRALGVRSAERGIPLDAVMHAFSLGYFTLWEALRSAASRLGPEAAHALLDVAGPMWVSLDQFTSALASGHHDASAVRAEDSRRRMQAFITALRRVPYADEEAVRAAEALGIDVDSTFVWSVCERSPAARLDEVALTVDSGGGILRLRVGKASRVDDERELVEELLQAGARHVGVGLVREGLLGARQSLLDAEAAHAAARRTRRTSVCFRDDWFACLVVQAADQLAGLLAPAEAQLSRTPELRGTVIAFLEEGGNLAAAAKRLHLHPNTVAYRLSRLAARSGLDVRSSSGVPHALAVLALHPP